MDFCFFGCSVGWISLFFVADFMTKRKRIKFGWLMNGCDIFSIGHDVMSMWRLWCEGLDMAHLRFDCCKIIQCGLDDCEKNKKTDWKLDGCLKIR